MKPRYERAEVQEEVKPVFTEKPATDKPIFPGGPMASEVESWKKQYAEVYLTEVAYDFFVWRPLNRYEYKHLMAIPDIDPLQREELICEQCVLWPKEFSFDQIANGKAGIPALLAEQIMQASGFDRTNAPRLL